MRFLPVKSILQIHTIHCYICIYSYHNLVLFHIQNIIIRKNLQILQISNRQALRAVVTTGNKNTRDLILQSPNNRLK